MTSNESRKVFFVEMLPILALTNLGVAQPLYDVLSRSPEFLVVRERPITDLLFLVTFLTILLPAVLLLAIQAAKLLSVRLGKGLASLFFGLLLFMTILPPVKLIHHLSDAGVLIVAALISAGILAFYLGFHQVRMYFRFLAPFTLLIPVLFLANSSIRKIYAPPSTAVSPTSLKSSAPIVFLIFDELPLTSLLNPDGSLDAVRFPNFGGLTHDFSWFRNATSVSDETLTGVPAILTGSYPQKTRLPTMIDYPNNLFTWLNGYRMKVLEFQTKLCPQSELKESTEGVWAGAKGILADAFVVYAHILLPADLAEGFPSVTEAWGNFWSPIEHNPRVNRRNQFTIFFESLSTPTEPTLFFLHLKLPHQPWAFLPSGKRHNFPQRLERTLFDGKMERKVWKKDPWANERAFHRHLLQLQYVDLLLGELIDKMKRADLYDRSLIVITSDHGVSFRREGQRRIASHLNFQDILPVPLFIKAPHQTTASISDRNVETIDILPTIAAILDLDLPWHVDGISAFRQDVPERKTKAIFMRDTGQVVQFPYDMKAKYQIVRQKMRLFGNGKTFDWLMSDPDAGLIGHQVKEFEVSGKATIRIDQNHAGYFQHLDLDSAYVPTFIAGFALHEQDQGGHVPLAIAVNGVFRAVCRTIPFENGRSGFAAMIPEASLRAGRNEVEYFVIREDGKLLQAEKVRP